MNMLATQPRDKTPTSCRCCKNWFKKWYPV